MLRRNNGLCRISWWDHARGEKHKIGSASSWPTGGQPHKYYGDVESRMLAIIFKLGSDSPQTARDDIK